MLQLPFTSEAFLEVFARYNHAVWPMPVVLYALAGLVVFRSVRPSVASDRWIAGSLGFLWVWMGVVYHWLFFADINPAARLFGGVFVLQGLGFLVAGARGRLSFELRADAFGVTGAAFVLYALVAYPLLGALAGHAYPEGPIFGLPCPTTIFTFGVLLQAARPVPVALIIVPAVWSIIGTSAALQLGIPEDYGLAVAGVVGTVLLVMKNRRIAGAAPEGPVAA